MKNWLKVYRKISFLLLNLKIQVPGTGSTYIGITDERPLSFLDFDYSKHLS